MSHGGDTTFVVALASGDDEVLESLGAPKGDWQVNPGNRTAEVAPGGRAVGFMSRLPLTGYDNYGLVGYNNSNQPIYQHVPEVFVYDAGAGRIACASCNPTGAAPIALSNGVPYEGSYVGMSGNASFMLRWIDEREGTQVYFMTNQPLVPDDTNAHQDVYEWESDGSGGCRQTTGCIALLSSAGPTGNAYFVDAGADGSDVFITSRASLTRTAFDETVKVYDVRAGGGVAETSLACTGTGCQGAPPAPPIFATPSSVTFNGVGDFEPAPAAGKSKARSRKPVKCKRSFARKHGKCVKSRSKKSKKARGSAKRRSAKKPSATRRGR
jgi:hypothetical protein